ncbi:Mitochondrial import inner membrane translocase subunit tim23 [Smittium mucronatum]|uniref:Mitochondrial import inner membrane translocase subunit tim23 n=1 Tax=Smittium mucronatum TaxID=133383 RepID=A0A1R0GSX8_9FUNG|nr:Mitochondrial import inner membrane translocase subunit tim23 [Smittium mucronatum]OLY80883.1 Mitochondrial import inner membrane translocase subunit tim23 [Smittium mucronatum]
MSIFNPYSRSANQPQQSPDFVSDTKAELDNQSVSGLSYGAGESDTSLETLMGGGVSDFLSQVNLDEGSAGFSKLTPLNSGIEYLSLGDGTVSGGSALPSRGWSDDLCYGTGTLYLSGLAIGGAWGFVSGARTPAKNFKIKFNGILNNMTRRGPFLGNSLGVLGLYYNSLYAIIGKIRDDTKDFYTSIYAAGTTGLIFRSTKGFKSAIVASIAFSGLMGVYQFVMNRDSIPEFNLKTIKQSA